MNILKIDLYNHKDEFIDKLYDSEFEFDGQLYSPKMTINANGTSQLTFSVPLKIWSKTNMGFIENPRWDYITKQYKVRVNSQGNIYEFVMSSYSEEHSADDQLNMHVTCKSLAEYELAQIGYNISFSQDSLYMYAEGVDPNDVENEPIGTYKSDVHFWETKLLENVAGWTYEVKSYYDIDEEMEIDNRQVIDKENELHTGPEQFYEDERIIGYDSDNLPIYATEYKIKERIITAEKSNVWNIQQDICEKFGCWPEFKIVYENGVIKEKKIILTNSIPEDSLFTIRYTKNLQSITREVDDSQVVTKMYVENLTNDNVDNGLVTIAEHDSNFMKENYILNFDWYLGKDIDNTDDLEPHRLIDSDLSYEFFSTNYATPAIEHHIAEGTDNVISDYMKNIRCRNIFISDLALQVSNKQAEYLNLINEYEFKKSSRDAALEQYNLVVDEWALCPKGKQVKEDRRCYIYNSDGTLVVNFGEAGIRAEDLAIVSKREPINLLFKGTNTKITNANDIEWTPSNYEPITGTVTQMQITNAILGSQESYGCFTIDLEYYPLYFYECLKKHWYNKYLEYVNRLNDLGITSDEGGIYDENKEEKGQIILKCEHDLKELKTNLYLATLEKNKTITEFEKFMSPFIKEGYWSDSDYGVYANQIQYVKQQRPIEEYLKTGTINTIDWKDDYLCFQIPNKKIGTYKIEDPYTPGTYLEKDVLLYDVIDINSIEIMTKNPAHTNEYINYKVYVKGTDFDVEYGYTASGIKSNGKVTIDESTVKRGIFAKFYQLGTYGTTGWQITKDTSLFIRFKARGNTNYIYQSYVKPDYDDLNGRRKFYVQMSRELIIKDTNIVLSSVKPILNVPMVQYDASYITLDDNQKADALNITSNQIELQYGTDYYTYKKVNDDGKTEVRINLIESTNDPLLSEALVSWFNIEYNQDITADYYYNDALDVMKKYQIPQTNYTISVQDISSAMVYTDENGKPAIDYSSYYPKVGTRVPIYDSELNFNGLTGFISSVTYDLLEPQNTSLTVSNYKDKFEDLFSKITQATIAMENKEYSYDRINNILDSSTGGRISVDLLQESLDQANVALSMSNDNNYVEINKNGITVWGKTLNENGVPGMLRITCGGIFTANEQDEYGSYIWNTAITPDFINADLLRAGSLDTRVINIFNSAEPRFMWNENGLYAYGLLSNGWTDYDSYVMYNHEGLKFREKTTYEEDIIFNNLLTFKTSNNGLWSTNVSSVSVDATTGIVKLSNSDFNIIEYHLSSDAFTHFVRGHKYYYRLEAATGNIPMENNQYTAEVNFYSGIKEYDYNETVWENIKVTTDETNIQWNRLEGYIEMNTEDSGTAQFGLTASLTAISADWWVRVRNAMIIDITESFNETSIVYPTLEMLSNLPFYVGNGTATYKQLTGNTLEVYNDSVVLDWEGLRINAQNDAVVLTATEGLVVNSKYNNIMNRRLQMGMWQEADGKHYGLRGYDQEATKVFQLDEDGLWLSGILDASKIIGRSSIHIGLKDGANPENYNRTSYNFNIDENGNVDAHTFNIYQPGGTNRLLAATSTGLHMYSPNNTSQPLSSYNSEGLVFYKMGTTNPLLKINGQGMYMYDGTGSSNPLNSYTSAGLGFYYSGSNQKVFNIGSEAMTFYNIDGATTMKIASNGLILYNELGDLAIDISSSGLSFYDENEYERMCIGSKLIEFYNTSGYTTMSIDNGIINFYTATRTNQKTMKIDNNSIDMYSAGSMVMSVATDSINFYSDDNIIGSLEMIHTGLNDKTIALKGKTGFELYAADKCFLQGFYNDVFGALSLYLGCTDGNEVSEISIVSNGGMTLEAAENININTGPESSYGLYVNGKLIDGTARFG